jgi:arsenite methyltransferase
MSTGEKSVILLLADISGYTRFMTAHEKALAHSQIVIKELIESILLQVELPLTVAKLEGDAIFLYAVKDGDAQVGGRIAERLPTFFRVFSGKVAELAHASFCKCSACANIDKLKLKVVAHSGTAMLYQLAGFLELSGVDVILVHRLLKNSANRDEYILLTEAARRDIALDGPAEPWTDTYPEIGLVRGSVYAPPPPEPFVPEPDAEKHYSRIFVDTLRSEVQREYSRVATNPEQGFHFHTGRPLAALLGYEDAWLAGLPEPVIESLAGTGNPISLGVPQPGERVVDVGCGAGTDSLIAAHMVGPSGQVIGVDMTPEMLDKARAGAAATGLSNVEFKRGYGETLPAPDGWADVVISNGVLNLMPDKAAGLAEMARVLKPGGRLQIGDILVEKPVPEGAKRDIDLWAG